MRNWRAQSSNRKIRNAVKVEIGDTKYDSRTEAYFGEALKRTGIPFEFRPKFILQEGFVYRGEKVREMTIKLDYWIPSKNMLVDVKGYADEKFPLKLKLLKRHLFERDEPLPEIRLPKNKRECDELLWELRGVVK